MAKRVLSIGQCVPDHTSLERLLTTRFQAEVVAAALPDEALLQLRSKPFDLVLVNRKLDADYSDGLEIIKRIKADPDLKSAPCMLVTNYPEYHEQATAVGAEVGFGKAELNTPETEEKLRKHLG
ncbi:MAG: response regulator [Planctomycetia bacterium]